MSKHILIVDDEADAQLLFKQRFRKEIRAGEYHLLFASNGEEALDILDKDPNIAIVVSDINMPVMDGLTLLENMQKKYKDIIPVIISAYGDMENIRLSMNKGAFDFVTKPIDFADLKITMEKALQHSRRLLDAQQTQSDLNFLLHELDIARHIQTNILPTDFITSDTLQLHALTNPARYIGGDFYDFYWINDHTIAFIVADVSGKGIPAALFMTVTRTFFRSQSSDQHAPGQCLTVINNLLCQDNENMMFVTTFYATLDIKTGMLIYANGGHNAPFIVQQNGVITALAQPRGIALGVQPNAQYDEKTVQINPGDMLFLYTDGVTEAINADAQPFGEARLRQALIACSTQSPKEVIQQINAMVNRFAQSCEQSDDITLLAIKIPNQQSEQTHLTLTPELSAISPVLDAAQAIFYKTKTETSIMHKCLLVLDELLSNIIRHGIKPPEERQITVDIRITPSVVTLIITDPGVMYNILQTKPKQVDIPIEDREEGGVGLVLVNGIMDTVDYQRQGDYNITTLTIARQ